MARPPGKEWEFQKEGTPKAVLPRMKTVIFFFFPSIFLLWSCSWPLRSAVLAQGRCFVSVEWVDGRKEVGRMAAAVSLLTTERWLGAQFWGRSHPQILFLASLCYLVQCMAHLKTLKIVVEWTNELKNKPNQWKKDLVGSVSGVSLKSFLSCSHPVQHPDSGYHTFCRIRLTEVLRSPIDPSRETNY